MNKKNVTRLMGDFGNARTTAVLKTQPYAILLVPKAEPLGTGYSVIPEDFEIALKGFNSEDPDTVAQVAQLLRIAADVLDTEAGELMDKAMSEALPPERPEPPGPPEDPDEQGRMYAGD